MLQPLKEQFTALIAAGAFEPVRRHVSPVEQDARMAEAVGQVWAMAARKAELGIRLDTALLVHAVKLRAIDHRRQLPRGGQPRRDVLHLANFIDGKVVVHRLDGLLDEDGDYTGDGDTALQSAWLAATAADPAETLASAVDLRDWVDGLAYEDRELLAARFAGKTLSEIATATDKSVSCIFSRLRQLGGDLAVHAGFTAPSRRRSRTSVGRPHENASAS
jgi:DNA-directed RNA polymerase specialized sigma24 family protein